MDLIQLLIGSRYPQILKYLKFNQTPKENIKGFEVTHIYTLEKLISEEISNAHILQILLITQGIY